MKEIERKILFGFGEMVKTPRSHFSMNINLRGHDKDHLA